jgi:hypothetical protein
MARRQCVVATSHVGPPTPGLDGQPPAGGIRIIASADGFLSQIRIGLVCVRPLCSDNRGQLRLATGRSGGLRSRVCL